MAIPPDPEQLGSTKSNGSPVMHPKEINRIAGELEKLFAAFTTDGTKPQRPAGVEAGSRLPPQASEATGSLPELQRNCAISEKHLGEWPAAMTFSMTATSSYSILVGESSKSGGLYSALIEQCEAIIKSLRDSAKYSSDAEQESLEGFKRYRQV